jgi:hypothetical protein
MASITQVATNRARFRAPPPTGMSAGAVEHQSSLDQIMAEVNKLNRHFRCP